MFYDTTSQASARMYTVHGRPVAALFDGAPAPASS